MALSRLLSLIATAGVSPDTRALARWTETPTSGNWDPEPEYGAFVDPNGYVVPGGQPNRAFLETDDPTRLELVSTTRDALGSHTLVFIDWGRQSLGWKQIFELWDSWESQGMILDCGTVGVPWSLAETWVCPGWIAFSGDFTGEPLSVTVRPSVVASFLAKAQQWRAGGQALSANDELEELPMLPFTIEDLRKNTRSWPQGLS